MTDEKLARRAARGDGAALELLIQRYHAPIFRYLYRLTADRMLAEELTQETFFRMVRFLRGGNAPRAFKPWLYRAASNLCRDRWKSADYRRTTPEEQPEAPAREAAFSNPVIELLIYQEERAAVVRAVTSLPPELRDIIVLRFYEELKLEEIADTLNLPAGTVKSRLYRAYRILKERLPEGKEGGAKCEQQEERL